MATTKAIATAAATKGTTATTKAIAMAETERTAPAITGYRKSDRYRGDAANKWRLVQKLPPFEIAFMPVRFDQVASCVINANDSMMCPTVELRIAHSHCILIQVTKNDSGSRSVWIMLATAHSL
jgi:hypothetical protein